MAKLSLAVAAAALAACANAQTWYGLRPNAANQSVVDLVTLQDNAVVQSVVGSVTLGPTEITWTDGFRCIRGFCLFSTTAYTNNASPLPTMSYVYNVSSADATLISKAKCLSQGFCRDMHVDYTTGRAFVTGIAEQATTVTEVTNGQAFTIVDITTAVGNGDIFVGQTTHCSEQGELRRFESQMAGRRADPLGRSHQRALRRLLSSPPVSN